MTNRTLFLLLTLSCWALCGLLVFYGFSGAVQGNRSGAKILTALMFLTGFGGFYFLMSAFSRERYRFRNKHHEHTTFSCPRCGEELDYSRFPAFKNELPCPNCGQALIKDGPAVRCRFIDPPAVPHELSSLPGAPVANPVNPEVIRTALTTEMTLTVDDDPDGWLAVTATGSPQWVARLDPHPDEEVHSVRPEDLRLSSPNPDLTVKVCVALLTAFPSLQVRACGADEWLVIDPSQAPTLAGQLIAQSLRLEQSGR